MTQIISINPHLAAAELAAWKRLNATLAYTVEQLERGLTVAAVTETPGWDGRAK